MRVELLAPLLVLLAVGACNGRSAPTESAPQKTPPRDAPPVFTEHVLTSQLSGIENRQRLVIRDADAWAEFLDDVIPYADPQLEPPTLNFHLHIVIAAAMGTRPTGGHSITIDEVRQGLDRLYVVVRQSSPGSGCVPTPPPTAPVTAVRVIQTDDPVVFVEWGEHVDCS